MLFLRRSVLAALLALGVGCGPAHAQTDAPVIAAASSLQFALVDIADRFTAETGMTVRLSFGSTGNFARQIREGAPFEMFMAADDTTIPTLADDGLTMGPGSVYAVGRIALVAPLGSALDVTQGLDGVAALLAADRLTRFAIANPDHAPFGIAARQALENAGLWQALQPKMVLGENVAQAAQFALSGNAEGGIIAYSLALAPQVARRSSHALIPADMHAPLQQHMVLLSGAGPVAVAFHDYLGSPEARGILQRFGFTLPAEG